MISSPARDRRARSAVLSNPEAFWSAGLWVRDCFGPNAPLITELAWLRVHRSTSEAFFVILFNIKAGVNVNLNEI